MDIDNIRNTCARVIISGFCCPVGLVPPQHRLLLLVRLLVAAPFKYCFNTMWSCECCGTRFQFSYLLLAHTVQQMKAGLYCPVASCRYHSRPFAQLATLTAHLRRHTGERGGQFGCRYCSKTFSRQSQMHHHEDSHSVSTPKVRSCRLCRVLN
jgi:hypothetical protein